MKACGGEVGTVPDGSSVVPQSWPVGGQNDAGSSVAPPMRRLGGRFADDSVPLPPVDGAAPPPVDVVAPPPLPDATPVGAGTVPGWLEHAARAAPPTTRAASVERRSAVMAMRAATRVPGAEALAARGIEAAVLRWCGPGGRPAVWKAARHDTDGACSSAFRRSLRGTPIAMAWAMRFRPLPVL